MSYLFAFITDTHLKEATIDTNLKLYEEVCIDMDKKGVSNLIHGGDVFDSRKAQSLQVLTGFVGCLQIVSKHNKNLLIIPGNHDKTDYESPDSFLDPFGWHPDIVLCNLPQVDSRFLKSHNVLIHMMPFFDDDIFQSLFVPYVAENVHPHPNVRHVLITHIGLDGVKMNSGSNHKSILEKDILECFDLVLIGHFHDRQQISSKIWYTGSALQHNFGENDQKGLIYVKDDLSLEFVKLESPPAYQKYSFTKQEFEDSQNLEALMLFRSVNPDTKIRIEVTNCEPSEVVRLKKVLSESGIEVVIPVQTIERIEIESSLSTYDFTGLKEEFIKFCEKRNLPLEEGLEFLDRPS